MDCRLIMWLAVVVFNCAFPSRGADAEQPCRECAERKRLADGILSTEELRQARIELIKRQILQKLRLSEPPKPSQPVLPSLITSEGILGNSNDFVVSEDNVDDYYGTTENVVLFPDNTTADGVRRSGAPSVSLRFHLNQLSSFASGMATAHLWVYRNEQNSSNVTYYLYDTQHDSSTEKTTDRMLNIDYVAQNLLPSWYRYDVTPSLGSWIGNTKTFGIDCYHCDSDPIGKRGEKRAFIIISADSSRHIQRQKRFMECSTGTHHCCREEFYLSFHEIGWDDWIIQPPGYKANFCRGSCESDISISRYHHTSLLQRVMQGQRAKKQNVTVSLCCTPSKMSSIMLLYTDKNNMLYQKRMPNMAVEVCDCA